MVQKTEKIIKELQKQIKDEQGNREKYSNTKTGFIRTRIITIEVLLIFIMSLYKRTLSVELESYFKVSRINEFTAGALTQRRKLLKHEIFIDMNDKFCKDVYKRNKVKRWQGKKIIAVDGTKINLFNKKEIVAEFGVQRTKGRDVPMAQIVSSYDVLNSMNIYSRITSLKKSEGMEAIERVSSYERDMIVLYDRGFPSFALMYHHIRNKIPFVMRMKKDFNKETSLFSKSKSKEKIVKIKISPKGRRVLREMGYGIDKSTEIEIRLIRVELENDFTIIATSLKNRKYYHRKEFKKLYNLRWGIETHFDKLKNKMKIETFTGRNVNSVKQECYSQILVSNIHSLLANTADIISSLIKNKKIRIHEYKTNQNVTIGLLKDSMVKLLISNNIKEVLSSLLEDFCKYKIPIKPDRKYERNKKRNILRGKNRTILNFAVGF